MSEVQNPPTKEEAIKELIDTEEMIFKRQECLKRKIEDEMETVYKEGTKNTHAALMALGRSNRYAKRLKQNDGKLAVIEMIKEAFEDADFHTKILRPMNSASEALKRANPNLVKKMTDIVEQQRSLLQDESEGVDHKLL